MRQIVHLIDVSMRYFTNADIDHHIFINIYAIIIVAIYAMRHVPKLIADEFYEGALTVKEDILEMKETIAEYRERWNNSQMHETLTSNFRSFDHFSRS